MTYSDMIRLCSALSIMLTGILVAGQARTEVPVPFAGKSGDGLAAAIRKECRPKVLPPLADVSFDFFDQTGCSYAKIVDGKPSDGYVIGEITPSQWWEVPAYGDTISRNLHNMYLLKDEVVRCKGDFPPGELTSVTYDYGGWTIGHGELYGVLTDLYSPPSAIRGRIARAMFYMAVMYPHYVFTPRGFIMLQSGYPYLTPYARTLLTRWSREYAPDEEESRWNDYAGALQGSYNPFVLYPELVEYIWGEKAGEFYAEEGVPVPIHSTYNVDKDVVYLQSPYVPADAEWSIDGLSAQSARYDARDMGVGEHTLSYISASTGERGCVLIKINP